MRIISWNINGIRAAYRKGFLDFLTAEQPEILGIQELRATPEDLPQDLKEPPGYHSLFNPAERKGYSGVALYSRTPPIKTWTDLGVPEFDREGRVIAADFGRFILYNVYFPNGSGNRDNSRVPYKLEFYAAVLKEITHQRAQGREVIVMGDFNTAHRPIDLARPKQNRKNSGFLPEECDVFQDYLDTGLVDSFRHFHGDIPDRYSWWTYRSNARARNIGWRIDYIVMTPGLVPQLNAAEILDSVMGSDHCPVEVCLSDEEKP